MVRGEMRTNIFLATLLLASIVGCTSPPPPSPRGAHILWSDGSNGLAFLIVPYEFLAKWEACFPNYRHLPGNDKRGFEACHELYFVCDNIGTAYRIVTDGTNWTNGRGTFAVSNDLFIIHSELLKWTQDVLNHKYEYLD